MTRGNVHVALLRGINVGGKNMLPMQDLVAMFVDAGCSEVRSYIQSGNVVFQAGQALVKRIPGLIAKAIRDRFGYQIPVLTRTTEEIRKIVRNNPFLKSGTDTGVLHFTFLADRPGAAVVKALDPQRSPPDDGALARGIGIYGLFLSPVIILALLSGHLHLDVHGFGMVVLGQSIWLIVCGALLLQRRE